MKLLACLLFAVSLLATPADVQFSTLGPWPLCPILPYFCMPNGQEAYVVLVKASVPEVTGFSFRVRYRQGGEVKQTDLIEFDRADAATGYSNSEALLIGKIDELLGVEVTEKF